MAVYLGSQLKTLNGGIPVESGGGSAKPFALRPDAELWKEWKADRKIVADDGITIPAYSTTAVAVKANGNLESVVFENDYDYVIYERGLVYPIYNSSTIVAGKPEYTWNTNVWEIRNLRASEVRALSSNTKISAGKMAMQMYGESNIVYWNSSNQLVANTSATYGTYFNVPSLTIGTNNTTLKYPAVNMRGYNTYFTQEAYNMMTDIRYQYIIQVYRVPHSSTVEGWYSMNNLQSVIKAINNNGKLE